MKLLLVIVLLFISFSTRGQYFLDNIEYFGSVPNGNSDNIALLDYIVFRDSLSLIHIRCPEDNFDEIDTLLKFSIVKNNDTVSFVEASLGLIAKATLKKGTPRLHNDTLRFFMGIPIFPDGSYFVRQSNMVKYHLDEDSQGFEYKDQSRPPRPDYLLAGAYRLQRNGSVMFFTNGDLKFELLPSGSFVTTFCNKIVFKGTYEIKDDGVILSERHFKFRLVKDKELYYIKRFN